MTIHRIQKGTQPGSKRMTWGTALFFAFSGLSLLCALGTSRTAHAAKFANQFVEFELPPQWQCNLEGAEWVCQSMDANKKRDAIIVLAAKLKGDQDSLDQYTKYLTAPKIYTSVQGKSVKSDPKYTKKLSVNNQDWIDSLHLESEIPGFYTRYLATVKEDIAVLVTYSINKDKYQQYLPQFDAMVNTLKVFRKAGALNTNDAKLGNIPPISDSVFSASQISGGSDQPKKKTDSGLPIEYIAAGAVLAAFIIWRRKKARG
jgi:hypothetical protein